MSREILFRGWCQRNEKWIEGDVIFQSQSTVVRRRSDAMSFKVDPSTVCQYIGLTDRNGVKVYEGDIIQSYEGLFTVDYCDDRACFMAVEIGTEVRAYLTQYMMRNDFEVVGNRWDTPKLLKEAAQYGDQDGLAPAT